MHFSQDLLCDSKGGGYLATKIKNLRTQQRQSQNTIASTVDEKKTEEQPTCCDDDLEELKHTVVNAENMNAIKVKLVATSKYRLQMIRGNYSMDLLENFPYFFTSHELVCE